MPSYVRAGIRKCARIRALSEADNFMTYLKTKLTRFLLAQIAMTQQISKATFAFVPTQDFTKQWTDEELFKKYKLTSEEIAFINRMIKEMN